VDGPQVEQQSEVVEVAIEKRVLVVPLELERYPPLEAIHGVRRADVLGFVHHDARRKGLLLPAATIEGSIYLLGNRRQAAARRQYLRPQQPERPHHLNDVNRKSTRLNSSHSHISYAVFCSTQTYHTAP